MRKRQDLVKHLKDWLDFDDYCDMCPEDKEGEQDSKHCKYCGGTGRIPNQLGRTLIQFLQRHGVNIE